MEVSAGTQISVDGYSKQSVREGSLRTADPLIEAPLSELFEK